MPASAEKDYDVLAYFHAKDDNGRSVTYHPDGNDGWPGAKATFKGDPSSERVKDLLAGAGGSHGPLIAEKKTSGSTSSASTSGKEN